MAGPNEFLTDLDTDKLFRESDLSASADRMLPSADAIKNKLVTRKKTLDQMVARIVPSEDWSIAYDYLKEIEPTWVANIAELQTAWTNKNRAEIQAGLKNLALILLNYEVQIGPALMNAEHGLPTQAAATYAADLIQNRLRADLDRSFAEVKAISERTADTKAALDATTSFRDHVRGIQRAARRQELGAYAALVLVLGGLATCEIYLPKHLGMVGTDALAARLALGALALFAAFFFHGQHRIGAAMQIKYQHLSGLLNGGAVDLIALLKDHEDFRKKLLEKMADAFMDTSDITSAIHKTKTPTEDVLALAKAVVDSRKS